MDDYRYFVAHEFSPEQRYDLRESIEQAFEGTELEPFYADDEVRRSHVLEKIKDMIYQTLFGIYDISEENVNVYLELGIAIAAGKPYYIICKKGSSIPADVAGFDRIEYESHRELTNILKNKVANRFDKSEVGLLDDEDTIIKSCIRLYQAEEISHRIGVKVNDKEARNGVAWTATYRKPIQRVKLDHIVYGPFEPLPRKGFYYAVFRIKTDDNLDPGPIILLDVYSGNSPPAVRNKAEKIIKGTDFTRLGCYELFALRFEYNDEDDLEYRVHHLSRNKPLWIDYVSIIPG